MRLLISWVCILAWLVIMVAVQLYFSWLWLSDGVSPRRHEALLGVAMAAFYALPAFVGLVIFRWFYWSESPTIAKHAAAVLVMFELFILALSIVVS